MIPGRPYQEIAAREAVPLLWLRGHRNVICVSPVGSGKVRMAAMLAEGRLLKGSADFWHGAHRTELITQPRDQFKIFGLPATTVLAGEDPDSESSLRVFSVQTLNRRSLRPRRRVAVISVDECHRVVGNTWMRVLERFRAEYEQVWSVGWTATPYRLDGRSLGAYADALYEAVDPLTLIEQGVLMEPRILGLQEPDVSDLRVLGGDYASDQASARVDKPSLVGDIVESWLKHAQGAPTALFAQSRDHSKHIVERMRARGIRVEHLDGETPRLQRKRILARLAIGGLASDHPEALDVVSNVEVMTEGWDSESDYRRVLEDLELRDLWLGLSHPPEYHPLQVVSDCAITASMREYRQREGRVCRSFSGELDVRSSDGNVSRVAVGPAKRWALILSHSGNWRRHGLLRDHYGFSLDPEKQLATIKRIQARAVGMRHCLECLSAWPGAQVACGSCGASLARAAPLPEEDASVELTEVRPTVPIPPPSPALERSTLRGMWKHYFKICAQRKAKGLEPAKPLMVSVMFQRRFGRWPGKEMLTATRAAAQNDVDER